MKQIERVIPKYCENIIVAAVWKRHFDWYVTPKKLWKMDYRKLYRALAECYAKLGRSQNEFLDAAGNFEHFCAERYGIEVLDTDNAGSFFAGLVNCRYTADELKFLLAVTPDADKNAFKETLYVDFDRKELISFYPEPEGFEKFIPDGWNGKYEDFTTLIPDEKRFRG